MYSTGDPDRAPVRCTEPSGYAHTGGEAAFAALTALWTGHPHRVDALDAGVRRSSRTWRRRRASTQTGFRGRRRGREHRPTREIWPTSDGFVSFGLRGGKARVPSLEIITKAVAADGIDASALEPATGASGNPNHAPEDELARDRDADRRVLRPAHDAGAVRARLRDQPHARTRPTRRERSSPARSSKRGSSSPRSTASSASRARSCTVRSPTARPRRSRPRARTRARHRVPRSTAARDRPGTSAGRPAARRGTA